MNCANLGAKTISAAPTTCAAVFKLAQRRGWVAHNPAAIAERPRRAVAELTVADETDESDKGLRAVRPDEVLRADEIKKLLNHAAPGLYRTLFATVAATGMRPEEALCPSAGPIASSADPSQRFLSGAPSPGRAFMARMCARASIHRKQNPATER